MGEYTQSEWLLARTLGAQVRAERLVKGTALARAAEKLGVGRDQLLAIEKGRQLPSIDKFLQLLAMYELNADALLGWRPATLDRKSGRFRVVDAAELATVVGPAARRKRLEFGVSRRRAAARLSITSHLLKAIELGQCTPSLSLLARLVGEFDLNADALLRPVESS